MRQYAKRPDRSETPEQPKTVEPGTVTSVEAQKHSTTRYSIFLDGAFAFGVGRDLLLESGIANGEYLGQERIDAILARDAIDRAVSTAMRALEQRMQTSRELRTRLLRKGFDSEAIDGALAKLVDYGYLNDERFAELWIENRLAHRPRGKRMLEQELRQKGVDRQIVDETVAAMEIDDRSAALELAQKRLRSVQGLPADEQRKKLTGILARKGFDFGVIRATLETVLDQEIDPAEMGDPESGVV
jgi:regulatory protein